MNKKRTRAHRKLKAYIVGINRLTEREISELNVLIEAYYASHWRDDDSPQAEETLGVKRLLAF